MRRGAWIWPSAPGIRPSARDVAVMYQSVGNALPESTSACSLLMASFASFGCRRSSPAGIAVPVTANAGAGWQATLPDFVKVRGRYHHKAQERLFIHQHNRRGGRGKQLARSVVNRRHWQHDRQPFRRAMFARPQCRRPRYCYVHRRQDEIRQSL
ncbi:hypothetical protein ACVXHA_03525 [Escherichia coli]